MRESDDLISEIAERMEHLSKAVAAMRTEVEVLCSP
jgi:hypothetical protein